MKKNFIFGLALFLMLFLIVGCEQIAGGKTEETGSGVSFDNFTSHSVSIKNNTGERLVAFKGSIEASNLISGVPAHASNHGLKKNDLFSDSGDFALQFVTEADYIAHKDDLDAIKNKPFASMYAFYNANGTNEIVYEISSKSGGAERLVLNNNTAYNVEIRLNSPNGEVLGYVPANTVNTTLNIDAGDYSVFPVLKIYIPRDNEIYSIKPTFQSGTHAGKPFSYDFSIYNSEPLTLQVGNWYDPGEHNLTAGGFYLTVNNQNEGGIRLLKGTTVQQTSLGVSIINSGDTHTFFIPFPQNPDRTYPSEMLFSALKLGSQNYPNNVDDYTFKNNYNYTITVTGSSASDLTIGKIVEESEVDIDALFN